MLISIDQLIGAKVLSMQSASQIATLEIPLVDPDSLKIIAFYVSGRLQNRAANILATSSIREYSRLGCVVDSEDELVEKNDVIKISKVIDLNFSLIGLKVITKKDTKLGRVADFTVTHDNFTVEQLIVKRPLLKSFSDPTLVIPRDEIVEVTDDKIVVRDEEDTIRQKAAKAEFIPNFVNPFRKSEPAHAKDQS